MKFNKTQSEEALVSTKKNINKKKISDLYDLENFDKYRFGNVGVFITSRKNIPFKFLSSTIHDGEKPVSWTIKAYYNKNNWNVQMGIHPNADSNIDIFSVLDKFKSKFPDVEVIGHSKVASILKISSSDQVEDIVNSLIRVFKGVNLDLDVFGLDEGFKVDESKKFSIPIDYSENVDKHSYNKFMRAVSSLEKAYLDEKEVEILSKIKKKLVNEKVITEKGKKFVSDLMKEHLSEHERISIAMKSLYNDN